MYFKSILRCLAIVVLAAGIAAPVAFAQEADLSATKLGPSTAAAGTDVSYGITVFNVGPDDSANVILTDLIPSGMTFVSESHAPAFACSTPAVGSGGTVTCTAALLTAGSTSNFTFVFNIPSATPPGTDFTNVVSVTSGTFDPSEENNSSSALTSTPALPQTDLSIAKDGPERAVPDSDIVYSISVANTGGNSATNVVLSDKLPGSMTFVSLVQESGPTMSCSPPPVGSGGTINCSLASFAASSTATFTLTGHVPPGTPSGTTFQNDATVSADNDVNGENNTATTILTVSSANVGVAKTGPATSDATTSISYLIIVANDGPDTATVNVSDFLPPGTTFVSITQNTGPAATCTPPVGINGEVACTVILADDESAVFTLMISPGANTSVTNIATVASDLADGNPADNSASATTTITQSSDLSVTKSDSPDPVPQGANITYNINVTNNGPSNAQSISLTDAVPVNTTFVSFTAPGGWTISTPPAGGTGNVSATIPALGAGLSGAFTFVVATSGTVTPGTSITNVVTVDTSTADPAPGNDSATESTLVGAAQANLSVTKTDSPDPVSAGGNINYTINVVNNGPSPAQTVALTDSLPVTTTFVSFTGSAGWTLSTPPVGGTGNVTATIPTLASGAAGAFTLVVATSSGAAVGATIINGAAVDSSSADPNPANNLATATTTIGPNANIATLSPGLLFLLAAMLALFALMKMT